MASVPDRFDEAEADVDHGKPWMYREPDAPNPLTILVTDWSQGHTSLGEAEFMSGVDRHGQKWSVLVGNVVLTKKLIQGLVEEWNEETGEFEVVDVLGRVEADEVVSIKWLGDRQGATFKYPDFRVSRKPAEPAADRDNGPEVDLSADDDNDEKLFGVAS